MKDVEEWASYGEAPSGLLDVAGRTEKVDEILLMVRAVPEDGAEAEGVEAYHRSVAGRVAVLVQSWLREPDLLPRNTFEALARSSTRSRS